MKKSFKLILIILIVTTLSGCKLRLNPYEDKLYSERSLTGYVVNTANQNTNILTREKAIEKAILIFDKGLDVKIDRTKLSESIRLYRDSLEDSFKWQITWNDISSKETYDCVIDSSNSEVISISSYTNQEAKNETNDKKDNNSVLSIEDTMNIIKPLLSELNININDISLSEKESKIQKNSIYAAMRFYNINDHNKGFDIFVDCKNEKVISYSELKKYIYKNGDLYD